MTQPIMLDSAFGRGSYDCGLCGGIIYPKRFQQHENYHNAYTNHTGGIVSNVLWCDPGNHAFKAGAPGSLHFRGELMDDDGIPRNQEMDACADHNPMRSRPENIVKELNSEYPIEINND